MIVVGQTLGPELSERERDFLGAALVRVDLLGVRELPSCELAIGMGVPQDRVRLQFDDAFFLAGAHGGSWREPLADLDKPWSLVTVDASWGSPQGRQRLTGLATQLAGVAYALEAELVFVPHVGGESVPEERADLTVGLASLRCRSQLCRSNPSPAPISKYSRTSRTPCSSCAP